MGGRSASGILEESWFDHVDAAGELRGGQVSALRPALVGGAAPACQKLARLLLVQVEPDAAAGDGHDGAAVETPSSTRSSRWGMGSGTGYAAPVAHCAVWNELPNANANVKPPLGNQPPWRRATLQMGSSPLSLSLGLETAGAHLTYTHFAGCAAHVYQYAHTPRLTSLPAAAAAESELRLGPCPHRVRKACHRAAPWTPRHGHCFLMINLSLSRAEADLSLSRGLGSGRCRLLLQDLYESCARGGALEPRARCV